MRKVDPIFFLDIGDLHMEAVLDGGFWNTFSHVADLHCHTYYELMLCPRGFYQIHTTDGASIDMQPDSLCLIPPRVYHRLSGDTATEKLAIRFLCTRNLKQGAEYSAFMTALEGISAPMHLGEQPQVLRLALQVSQELQQQSLAADTCVQSLLTQLLICVLRLLCPPLDSDNQPPQPNETPARRLAIEDYLNNRYAEALTEEALAAHLHLSKRQLSRTLQKLYGMSFRQLLIDIRLNRAVQLLCSTNMTPEAIAYQVGYTSISGFYDAFRKRYGIAAGSYRRQLHK